MFFLVLNKQIFRRFLLTPKSKYSKLIEPNKKELKVKIGLEIHARILSKTKIFSDASCFDLINTPVNKNVAFFDAALPGTMPVLNSRAIEAGISTALALNCEINAVSSFERKHYFYADLPAGYQITQQRNPIAKNGLFKYPVIDPKTHKLSYKQCRIKRIQLEHDSARSLQIDDVFLKLNKKQNLPKNASLIDLNRAGMGLMEIVTEPDFESAFECYSFARELALTLKSIETCDAQMGEGGFRVDVNVSVHEIDKSSNPPNLLPGIRVELKNLSSFNSILKGTEYEIRRQKELKNRSEPILLETRTYDSTKGKTISLRSKEDQYDYRFMPEPNLLPIFIYSKELESNLNILKCEDNKELCSSKWFLEQLDSCKTKDKFYCDFDKVKDEFFQKDLPQKRRMFLVNNYGISEENAFIFISNNLDYIIKNLISKNNVNGEDVKLYVRVLLTEYLNQVNENPDLDKISFDLKCAKIKSFVDLIKQKKLSRRIWLSFFKKLFEIKNLNKLAHEIAEEEDLFMIVDCQLIESKIKKLFQENPKATNEFQTKEKKRGKIFNFFVGRVHKELRDAADPDLVDSLVQTNLQKLINNE